MENIEQYINRFNSLMESKIGDVKPLISEQSTPTTTTTTTTPPSTTGLDPKLLSDVRNKIVTNFVNCGYYICAVKNNQNVQLTNKEYPSLDKKYTKAYYTTKDIQNVIDELKGKYLSNINYGSNSASRETKTKIVNDIKSGLTSNYIEPNFNKYLDDNRQK